MLTTKRQIRNNGDSYRSYYDIENNGMPSVSDYGDISYAQPITMPESNGNSMLTVDRDSRAATPTEPITERPLYTTLENAATRTQSPARPVVPVPARKRAETPRKKEDLLPTIKTRAYAANQADAEKTAAHRERKGLEPRVKALLCVYIVIALVLAIAVIATGISISSTAAQADSIAVGIAQKHVVIAEQEKQLAALRDENVIRDKAISNGMVSAGAPAYSVALVDNVDYPEAQPRSDGFDEFCDAMSKIFA